MEEYLLKLNFNLKSKGFFYWIKAFEIAIKNPKYNMNFIYNEVANFYNTTFKDIERCMRTASQNNNISELYQLPKKQLSNSEILRFLIIQERKENK